MNNSINIPTHVAIIMDGNRRWAKKRNLPSVAGHKKALDEVVEKIIEEAGNLGIKYLTFWAWSTENWERDQKEVSGIMKLFKYALRAKVDSFSKKGARLKVIGGISEFSQDLQKGIEEAIKKTEKNDKITVVFALNYGGRDEIIRAINKFNQEPRTENLELTEEKFSLGLDTKGIPDPDLIIRTGGEKRLSGFLLWQSEYSELCFIDTLFPDLTKEEFGKIIRDFSDRDRRFGK